MVEPAFKLSVLALVIPVVYVIAAAASRLTEPGVLMFWLRVRSPEVVLTDTLPVVVMPLVLLTVPMVSAEAFK